MRSDERTWDDWNRGGGPKYPHEKIVQFVFRTLPKTGRDRVAVLDLGCGSGVHTQFLAAEGFATHATDISPVGVQNTADRCARLGLQADVRVGTVSQIGFPDGAFDCVISIGVLECAGAKMFPIAMREIVRVLKPGGAAFLVFASDSDFRVTGPNEYGLHGFTDAEIDAVKGAVPGGLEYFWMDRYITTYQDKALQQNDHLLTLRKTGR